MKIPETLINGKKKYYLVKIFKNFVMYQTSKGIAECFTYHDLGLIRETSRIREANKLGDIKID